MRRTATAARGFGVAILVLAPALAFFSGRYALASARVFSPDTPGPALPGVNEQVLDDAVRLAPGNAIYRYWRAERLLGSMLGRWLEGDVAREIGQRAREEISVAIAQLPVDAELYVRRASICIDLARHPTSDDDEEATLLAAAADDLERALQLRGQAPSLVDEIADLVVAQWRLIHATRPELAVDVLRRAARMNARAKMRLANPRRLEELWHTLTFSGQSIEEAVATLESVVPVDHAQLQTSLARLFGRLARSPSFPRTSPEHAREVLGRAAADAAARAAAAQETGDAGR